MFKMLPAGACLSAPKDQRAGSRTVWLNETSRSEATFEAIQRIFLQTNPTVRDGLVKGQANRRSVGKD